MTVGIAWPCQMWPNVSSGATVVTPYGWTRHCLQRMWRFYSDVPLSWRWKALCPWHLDLQCSKDGSWLWTKIQTCLNPPKRCRILSINGMFGYACNIQHTTGMNFQPGAVQLVLQLRSYVDSPRFVGTPPPYRKASDSLSTSKAEFCDEGLIWNSFVWRGQANELGWHAMISFPAKRHLGILRVLNNVWPFQRKANSTSSNRSLSCISWSRVLVGGFIVD